MKDFQHYLETTQEIGTVEQVFQSIVYVEGLPDAKPREVVLFETGELGEVISLTKRHVEVLLFSKKRLRVGTRVTRTNEQLQIPVSDVLLGKIVDPLALGIEEFSGDSSMVERRSIDIQPLPMMARENVREALETGVMLVDTVVPLGVGQRELVIGDRKTSKTQFVMQSVLALAKKGYVCIYGAIAKRQVDVLGLRDFFQRNGILEKIIIVASTSSDPSGLIFLTPYSAMTMAEYFRDQGRDVLIILDDLSIHAKAYREISLLAKRFPGRSSYPGDIFYIHSRLMERAGNFNTGSITCLPIAEAVFGDLSGYIQTNLMAMTDGHLYFDRELANLGRRPPINPFLSVTRVGHQTQTPLMRDLSRELSIFLVSHDKMRQFMHFGGEVSEQVKRTIDLGNQVLALFDQPPDRIVPLEVSALLIAGLWAGVWSNSDLQQMKEQTLSVLQLYNTDQQYRSVIHTLVTSSATFAELIENVKHQRDRLIPRQAQQQVAVPSEGGQQS